MIKEMLRSQVTVGSKFGLQPNHLGCMALNVKTGDQLGIAHDAFWHVNLFTYTVAWLLPETKVYVND